jgi:hypothetical protein
VPAVYVGVDEGQALERLAQNGGVAKLSLSAANVQASTRMLVATLPGVSPERIVVESHTDGMNAIWDNGPIAILALARHFASLPLECRARTLQFVFTTGHLYQHLLGKGDRGGSAEVFAQQLDKSYDSKGDVALVVTLEHMGARGYELGPRPGGLPGLRMAPTGDSEATGIFVNDSPALVGAVDHQVIAHNLRRTIILRGADLPNPQIPLHKSAGGEGTEYYQHLIPTVALITGPGYLFDPTFGMETLDGQLLRNQTLTFADLLHDVATLPKELLGGGVVAERAARQQVCASAFAGLGLVNCTGPWG